LPTSNPNAFKLFWTLDISWMVEDTKIYSTEITTVTKYMAYNSTQMLSEDYVVSEINKFIQDYGLQLP
jgi:hypothetical protein